MPAEWYKEQISNRNYLSPVGFKLVLEKFRGVDFFCQRVNLPDVTMPFTEVPTRFRQFPIVAGGGVTYGDLTVSFIVDEELINWKEIYNWIRTNGNSEEHMPTEEPEYCNGQVLIYTSSYNINHVINFENLFPISISEMNFNASSNDIEYFTAQVTFKYTGYTIRDEKFTE
tara:strand:- start:27 stop:539 length:513 start_codon:yes stop_codon:yes gene_type:complete